MEKAPRWGGVFERLVKLVKRCLRKTVGSAKLTYDELMTVVTEAETILNCRPLSFLSSEDIEEPLTPSPLLCGRRLLSLPPRTVSESFNPAAESTQGELCKRLSYLSNVMNHFWKRWRDEYLMELRATHRNVTQASGDPPVSVGDVVVIHDDKQPRATWKLGKVVQLIVRADGHVRGAVVRVTSKEDGTTTLRRPVQQLYPLLNTVV